MSDNTPTTPTLAEIFDAECMCEATGEWDYDMMDWCRCDTCAAKLGDANDAVTTHHR